MSADQAIALAIAAGLLLVLGLGWRGGWLEHSLIFYPVADLVATPADVGLAYEDVRFGPDRRLHGWFVPGTAPVTILWFHGNAGNISHRVEALRRLRDGLGAGIFIFDYSGYGRSGGSPSEENAARDARAALAYLRSRPDQADRRLVYYGKSLGGAVAAELAVEHPPDRLILQSTFTSVPDVARTVTPWLPVDLLFRSRFATIERVGRIRAPILVVHGDRDTLVPLEQAQRLQAAAPPPKSFYLVRGAGHNDLIEVGGAAYLAALRSFIAGGS